jgi:putative transposase
MSHLYRLYPNQDALPVLRKHCGDARWVKNKALERLNAGVPRAERARALTQDRQTVEWLGQGSSAVQQQALREFERAVSNWAGKTHRKPTWWKRGIAESFCVRDVRVEQISRKWAAILIPKAGLVKFRISRPLPVEHGMAHVRLLPSGRWTVSFSAPQPGALRAVTGQVVGLDLGVAETVTTSDAEHLNPHAALSPGQQQRLRRLERKRERQKALAVCGELRSRRREKVNRQIARLHERRTRVRHDFVEQVSTMLVRRYDLIALEDLNVKGMLKSASGTIENPGVNVAQKRGLNRSISEQNWGRLRQRIADKAAACGVTVIAVNPAYTSQQCSVCGHIAKENRKSQADFQCVTCRHQSNADVNAARNILAAGLAVYAHGGTPQQRPGEVRIEPTEAAA